MPETSGLYDVRIGHAYCLINFQTTNNQWSYSTQEPWHHETHFIAQKNVHNFSLEEQTIIVLLPVLSLFVYAKFQSIALLLSYNHVLKLMTSS